MHALSPSAARISNASYAHRRLLPAQPWWQHLDPAFYRYPDHFHLDPKARFMVDSTAMVDLGLRTALASFATTLALPVLARKLSRDHAQWDFYARLADSHDAERVFARPQQTLHIRRHKPGLLDYRPREGRVEILSFESHFQTLNPALREDYARHRRNRIAWAEHWRHDGPARPTLCVIHGFVADPYWINSRFLALPWFYQQGYDVLLYTLPFHGRRQERHSPFSGHGYFSHGLGHLNETMRHAVHDFRLFLDYLEDCGSPAFGVTGISLGGFTSALLATVEDRLAFAIPNVPLASIVDLVLEWSPASEILRTALRLGGSSLEAARHASAATCPLSFPPKLPKQRLMIVAGAGDRFASPKHSRLLWEHWQQPALHWFPGNHLLHLDQGNYLHAMQAFLQTLDF